MFGKKRSNLSYDPGAVRPVLKCSICTGEQVAGFQNLSTGKIEEVMLVRSPKDLERFRASCGLAADFDIPKVY
ncbi:MAG: aspartate dehydrogenase [Faecalibacterium sp.]